MLTSRFKNISHFGNRSTPISISRWSPSWYFGRVYQKLAPPGELVLHSKRHGIEFEDYQALYTEHVLDLLDPHECWEELHDIGENPIILCHEDLAIPGEWCHRRIVAEWFEVADLGTVPEWTLDRPKQALLKF